MASKPKSAKMGSKRNPRITNIFLGIILVAAIIYIFTGKDVFGIFSGFEETPTITEIAPSTPTNIDGNWWEVYFTDPINHGDPERWGGSIEDILIQNINEAKISIHIASFEFDLTPVAEALIAAKKRGVDVRWVTDDEHGIEADEEPGHGQFAMMSNAGIKVEEDDRSALMHNKFWLFDGHTVWTGSTNVTVNGIFKQNNNVIVMHSTKVAEIYEREFQEMWNGEFGPRSPSTLNQQSVTVNGSFVKVLFASEDGVIGNIIPYVERAQTSIRFLAFSFTDYPLAKAMIDRANVGVDVAGVFEKVGSETEYAELRTLLCSGIPVRQDGNPSFLHHKLIVVDERFVITGSLNFSTNAEESNDENLIIIDNPNIAKLYIEEFERMWNQGIDPDPKEIGCK